MTVGIYLNDPLPIIISDCLALPRTGNAQIYSPSNIEHFDGENGELARLVSKFIKLESDTVITFAGRSDHINDFVQNFPALWELRDQTLRPMQFLHNIDEQLRAARNNWGCSVLGATLMPKNSDPGECLTCSNTYASKSDNWQFQTENFGTCHSIGTGAAEMRKFIENADRNLSLLKVQEGFDLTEPDLLFRLLGALNGQALFCQKMPLEEQSWGGLLQAQVYFPFKENWFRTPPWLHLCVAFKGEELELLGVHKKTVFHTSKLDDDNAGVVVTAVMNSKEQAESIIWPVYSLFKIQSDEELITYSDIMTEPKMVTITVVIQIEKSQTINQNTYSFTEVSGLSASLEGDVFNINYDAKVLGDWLRNELLRDPSFRLPK